MVLREDGLHQNQIIVIEIGASAGLVIVAASVI